MALKEKLLLYSFDLIWLSRTSFSFTKLLKLVKVIAETSEHGSNTETRSDWSSG